MGCIIQGDFMANKIGEGQWQGLDGKIYASEGEANTQSGNVVIGGGGGGGGPMNLMAGGFLVIFIIGPIIVSLLVGLLWGLLLKLRLFGRILTTVLMLLAGPFILGTVLYAPELTGIRMNLGGPVVENMIFAAFITIPTAWYFLWHYDAVRLMGAWGFAGKIKTMACFIWFGAIIGMIIALFAGKVGAAICLISGIAGIVFYLVSSREEMSEALANPSIKFPAIVKIIVMAVAVALIPVAGVATQAYITKFYARLAEGREARAEEAKSYKAGMKVVVIEDDFGSRQRAEITDVPRPTRFNGVTVVKEVRAGDILTVTGDAVNETSDSWMVPVEHEGTKGFIEAIRIGDPEKVAAAQATAAAARSNTKKPTNRFPDESFGTWEKDGYEYRIIFDSRTAFRISGLGTVYSFKSVSGDEYTIYEITRPREEIKLTIQFTNNRLVISGASGYLIDNWNGTWTKQ